MADLFHYTLLKANSCLYMLCVDGKPVVRIEPVRHLTPDHEQITALAHEIVDALNARQRPEEACFYLGRVLDREGGLLASDVLYSEAPISDPILLRREVETLFDCYVDLVIDGPFPLSWDNKAFENGD